jgi:hypothetical protein
MYFHLLGVIMEVTTGDLYKIGTKNGIIVQLVVVTNFHLVMG